MGLLSRLLGPRAATPENPQFSLNDPEAWDLFLAGAQAASGVNVSAQTALTFSPWWRGINLIAADVGKLPLFIYQRQGQGKDRASTHPAYYLLRRKPNEYQTAFQFRRQLTGHALSRGNGYAFIERTGSAVPVSLLPLDPAATFPVRENGRVLYVTDQGGELRKLLPENVLHIKGFGDDGLQGYSVYQKAKDSLGLGIAQRTFESRFYLNFATAGVTLETDQNLPDEYKEKLRTSWNRLHAGLDKAHMTAVLDRGLKARPLSFNARDSQMLEGKEFSIRDVANFIGVPPHKLGDMAHTSYSSLEQENLSYLTESLDVWLVTWEEECWDKLLTEREKETDSHLVEFLRQALVRADLTTRGNYYRIALAGAPWLTINEVRSLENLNPQDGGDEMLQPLNMSNPGGNPDQPGVPTEGQQPEPIAPKAEIWEPIEAEGLAGMRAALTANFEEAVRRMVRRVSLHAGRAAKDPSKFLAWLDRLEEDHQNSVNEAIGPPEKALALLFERTQIGMGGWLLTRLREEYLEVSGQVRAADLPEAVNSASARLEEQLPGQAVLILLE